jgi:integrase
MATLGTTGGGSRRIQFTDLQDPGKRASIWLGRVPKKTAITFKANVEALIAAKKTGTAPAAELCAWLRDLPDTTYEKLVDVGLAAARVKERPVTLEELLTAFVSRASVKASTLAAYRQTTDSLRKHIGGGTVLKSITAEQADVWKKAIVDEGLSPATVAKRVFVAKAIFRKAVKWGMVLANPFEGLSAGSQQNPDRSVYISREVITTVLDQCPSVFWRLVIGLGRYAGLRVPSEVTSLAWDDVAWDTGRLTVRSPKTARHEGHAVRVVPICPELREILAGAFEQAAVGERLILPQPLTAASNLRTTFTKIITRAGFKPWPRLFQNLRASCATDWVERYPNHVVARWLGHSPLIAATHYLQAREQHFADVVAGGGNVAISENGAGQGTRADDPGGVQKCVQNSVQSKAASTGSNSHTSSKTPNETANLRDSAERRKPQQNELMGSTGFEPVTSTV